MHGVVQDSADSRPSLDSDTQLDQDNIDLIIEEIRWIADRQIAGIESVETRATGMMGISGAILAILFRSLGGNGLRPITILFIFITAVLSIGALFCSILIFHHKKIRFSPNPRSLLREYYKKQYLQTQLQIAVNRAGSFDRNEELLQEIMEYFRWSVILQSCAIGAIVITISLMIFLGPGA